MKAARAIDARIILIAIALLYMVAFGILFSSMVDKLSTTSSSIHLPLITKDYKAPDRRFVAWHGPLDEVQGVGLAEYNTISLWPAETKNLYVPFGTHCQHVAMWANVNEGRLYVMGDEPDMLGITPEEYLTWYVPCYTLIKTSDPSSKVAVAGIAQPAFPGLHGLDYLGVMYVLGFQTDQLRVHAFAGLGNFGPWQAYIEEWLQWRDLNMPGVPVALGTFGYPGAPHQTAQVLADMRAALAWLRTTELEQWCWWAWPWWTGNNHLYDRGRLTLVGEVWVEEAIRWGTGEKAR